MYLLYCDESNLEYKSGNFFVYGGIGVPDISALKLSDRINEIRKEYNVEKDFSLKFNPGPKALSHPEFISLKKDIISATVEAECELFVSLILHDIAKSPNEARLNEINRIAYHFNCYLHQSNESGLVLIDRFSDSDVDSHLREKFNIGVTNLPYSAEYRLDKILGFHYSAIGQSNFTSIIDIVIGSLRFAINEYAKNPENPKQSSIEILKLLSPLLVNSDTEKVPEIKLFFSPKTIKVAKYREKYQGLKDFLITCGIDPFQSIEERYYY